MNLPSGLVFYLDFQYGGTNVASPETAANAQKLPFTNANFTNSLYGTPSPVNPATNTSGFGNAAANWRAIHSISLKETHAIEPGFHCSRLKARCNNPAALKFTDKSTRNGMTMCMGA